MKYIKSILVALMVGLLLTGCGSKAGGSKLKAAEQAYRQGDFKTALEVFQPMAEGGNARAQFYLGEMYLNGSGVVKDYAQALKWAGAAAEQKDANAQFTLGGMYETGKGVQRDYILAHMWYSLSGTSGDEQAIRKKAELELKKMSMPEIEQSKQMEIKWAAEHRDK